MNSDIKCSCGIVHTYTELSVFLPDDEIEVISEIDCLVCPICKDDEIEDEYEKLEDEFVEEKYEQEDKTDELDDEIDKSLKKED